MKRFFSVAWSAVVSLLVWLVATLLVREVEPDDAARVRPRSADLGIARRRRRLPRLAVGATDYANLIPSSVSAELIRGVYEGSSVMRLARTTRVPAGTTSIPVVSVMPTAAFVAARGGRKPATVIEWSSEKITPEEIACVVGIPDDFIEDNTFPVWDEVRPLLAEALAIALDDAVLWGIGAPASFPVGGVEAVAGAPVDDVTPMDAVNLAMSVVEQSGLLPTGHAAGARAKPALRMMRDENGNLVYLPSLTQGAPDTLFGLPISFSQGFDGGTTAELLTGDWTKLVVGVRTDIRYELSTDGVLTDGAGVVTANAFQDDLTLMRVYMRVGAAIGIPVNRAGDPTKPFALAEFTPGLAGEPAATTRSTRSTRTRAAGRRSASSGGVRGADLPSEAQRAAAEQQARGAIGGRKSGSRKSGSTKKSASRKSSARTSAK